LRRANVSATWISIIVIVVLAVSGAIWRYICWQFDHKNVSKNNQVLINNHLKHHEERIEPWMQEIGERTVSIETKVDLLLKKE